MRAIGKLDFRLLVVRVFVCPPGFYRATESLFCLHSCTTYSWVA